MQQALESVRLPSDGLNRRIAALTLGSSVETATRAAAVEEVCRSALPAGTSVYITALPGDTVAAKIQAAARLREAGFNPVPHLGARHIASAAQLDEVLRGLVGEAQVERLLVIGGDADVAAGPYPSSLAVLESGLLEKHAIRRVDLAGYPEGHPKIPMAALMQAMDDKLDRLRRNGIAATVVTQFCFEAPPILRWLAEFDRRHGDVPVQIGLAGPAKLTALLKYAARCGIGTSLRALTRGSFGLRLLTDAGPERVIRDLAATDVAARGGVGLHLFTFGGVTRTSLWLAAITRGDFEISLDGEGFDVGT